MEGGQWPDASSLLKVKPAKLENGLDAGLRSMKDVFQICSLNNGKDGVGIYFLKGVEEKPVGWLQSLVLDILSLRYL